MPRLAKLEDTPQIRPITPADGPALRRGFERLSPNSRYRRFLAPQTHLSDREVRYLVDVDGHDHVALVAADPDDGALIGVARFVRLRDDREAAEAAIAVVDDWQGRGLGTKLLEALVERAHEEDVHAFVAEVLPSNSERMQALFANVGRLSERESGQVVHMRFDLPPAHAAPGHHLATALRAAASGVMALARRAPPFAPRENG
jgi:RimJ/RimL family protein N-acetyltransferase